MIIDDPYESCFQLCVERLCDQGKRTACIDFAVKALRDIEQKRCPEKIQNVTRRTDGRCSQVMIGFLLGGALGARKSDT